MGNTHALSRTRDRAFDNSIDVQLARNFRESLFCTLVRHHRSAGGYAQGTDLGQVGDQFIRHTIHEIILRGIAGKVCEWQNRDGAYWRGSVCPMCRHQQHCDSERNYDEDRPYDCGEGTRTSFHHSFGRCADGFALWSRLRSRCRKFLRGSDEPVSPPWQGLDVARILRRVPQDIAETSDRVVETVVEINKSIRRPDLLAQFFARN